MTLTQIVDDILLSIASVAQEKALQLERRQVEYWVDLYRLMLLRQDINDNSIIDPTYITRQKLTMQPNSDAYLEEGILPNIMVYESKAPLPKLPVLTGRFALLTVFRPHDSYVVLPEVPANGVQIPVGDWSHSRYMLFDRYNPYKNLATIRNKNLLIYVACPDGIYPDATKDFDVYCEMILCDPAKYSPGDPLEETVYFRDKDYPMPDEKIPRLKQMIFANELQWVLPARDTQQSSQMAKMEEKDMSNNPAALIQAGADLYEMN